MSRWPPLGMSRDADFYRQRIMREHRVRERDRPDAQLAAKWLEQRPMTSTSNFGNVFTRAPAARLNTPCVADPLVRLNAPLHYTRTMMPPRTAAHVSALREMSMLPWHEPPLVMARGFTESPRLFTRLTEASTSSAASPMAPLLPWKPQWL